MDYGPLLIALAVFHILLSLWLFRQVVFTLRASVAEIDSAMAAAISELVHQGIEGLGDFEPPNPIQQALAELLMNRVKGGPIAVELERTQDGKFS